jgi:hypothetical protein
MNMHIDDFERGQFVVVTGCIYNPEDRSLRGEILEVLHVDLPFILVEDRSSTIRRFVRKRHLDTREWKFKIPSSEYVKLKLEEAAESDRRSEALRMAQQRENSLRWRIKP